MNEQSVGWFVLTGLLIPRVAVYDQTLGKGSRWMLIRCWLMVHHLTQLIAAQDGEVWWVPTEQLAADEPNRKLLLYLGHIALPRPLAFLWFAHAQLGARRLCAEHNGWFLDTITGFLESDGQPLSQGDVRSTMYMQAYHCLYNYDPKSAKTVGLVVCICCCSSSFTSHWVFCGLLGL